MQELKHWGIIGMKWGLRRFQNPDGSLTEEGRARYNRRRNSQPKLTKSIKKNVRTIRSISDEDLTNYTKRLRLENDYLSTVKNRRELDYNISGKASRSKAISDTVKALTGVSTKIFDTIWKDVGSKAVSELFINPAGTLTKNMVSSFSDSVKSSVNAATKNQNNGPNISKQPNNKSTSPKNTDIIVTEYQNKKFTLTKDGHWEFPPDFWDDFKNIAI